MFTRSALMAHIQAFLQALKEEKGYHIRRVVLFGSYAKGGIKPTSDIDLAIWADEFEGNLFDDLPPIVGLVSRFHPISIRPFPTGATETEFPFIGEIEKASIEIECS